MSLEQVLVFVLLATLLYALLGLIRNQQVYRFLMGLAEEVRDAAQRDIAAGRPWEWRYLELAKLSYNEMVLKIWRPLPSFVDREKLLGDPKT